MEIQGRVAIVTGASGGIGLATARLFAQHGAKVALVARSTDKLNALAGKLPNSLAITADMRHAKAIRMMIEAVQRHYGRIDILVNNAGRAMLAPVEHTDPAYYQELLALNVLGPLIAMQAVIPLMRQQGGGMIVN